MGQAQHFDQGQNWKAKNAASIKLRAGDGRKHEVTVRDSGVHLTDAEIAEAAARRDTERARLDAERAAQEAARRGRAREQRADTKTASKDHTPSGWVPANKRTDYSDPLARANDPRRPGPATTKGQKKRRAIRPGN